MFLSLVLGGIVWGIVALVSSPTKPIPPQPTPPPRPTPLPNCTKPSNIQVVVKQNGIYGLQQNVLITFPNSDAITKAQTISFYVQGTNSDYNDLETKEPPFNLAPGLPNTVVFEHTTILSGSYQISAFNNDSQYNNPACVLQKTIVVS